MLLKRKGSTSRRCSGWCTEMQPTRTRITWCLGCHRRGNWQNGRCPNCLTTPQRTARKQALYGTPHRRTRAAWLAHIIEHGPVPCPYCGHLVGIVFDLDHDSGSRPSHPRCNRAAGGRKAHK